MFDPNHLIPRTDRLLAPDLRQRASQRSGQRRTGASLVIFLLLVLVAVLYWNRAFWFPEDGNANLSATPLTSASGSQAAKKKRGIRPQPSHSVSAAATALEKETAEHSESQISIEVVDGNGHKLLRPRRAAIDVNLDPNAGTEAVRSSAAASLRATKEPAPASSTISDDVPVSVDTSEIVEHAEAPDYPLLARQMKIKGSVILDALIGRDGIIESLVVVSGAPILADAAKEAVRKWHFRPHQLGVETVEASTKIKVNFVISTY